MEATKTAEKGAAANGRLDQALKAARAVLGKVQARQGEVEKLQRLDSDLAMRILVLEDSDPTDEARIRELLMASMQRQMAVKKLEGLQSTDILKRGELEAALEGARSVIREVLVPRYQALEAEAVSAIRGLCTSEPEAVQMARTSPKLAWLGRLSNANTLGGSDIGTLERAAQMLEQIAAGDAEQLLAWPAK